MNPAYKRGDRVQWKDHGHRIVGQVDRVEPWEQTLLYTVWTSTGLPYQVLESGLYPVQEDTVDEKIVETGETVDITPNYKGVFNGMMRDAESYAARFDRLDIGEKEMHSFISRIAVAIMSMTETADLTRMQECLGMAAEKLNDRAFKKDEEED